MLSKDKIYDTLNLKEEDIPIIKPFMQYSFFMGVSVAIFYTATMSLFLNTFERSMLPKVYIVSGIIVYLLGFIVNKFQHRFSFSRVSFSLIIFLIITVACLLILHYFTGNKWIYFFLFIWNRVFVFVNGISFWAVVSRIFKLQQAKRLISFITTGDVLSSIISYLSVPLLLRFTHTQNLLYISVAALVICLVMVYRISKKYATELSDVVKKVNTEGQNALKYFFKSPYYTVIFFMAMLPVVGLFFVEFIFSIESKYIFPERDTLTSFLGLFFGVCAIIELLIKLFLYGRIIEKYGLKLALIILPFGLTLFFGAGAIYGTFYGNDFLFFAFIVMSRLFMSSFRKSISEPSFQILFQPITPNKRLELLSRIEGGPKALGNILAGVLLMVLTYFSFMDSIYISYIFLAILLAWVGIALKTQVLYLKVLKNLLVDDKKTPKMQIRLQENKVSTFVTEDDKSIEKYENFDSIVKMTTSEVTSERLKSVDLLVNSGRYFAFKHIELLLQDNNQKVKTKAILAAVKLERSELWPYLINNISSKYFEQVATQALKNIGEPVIAEFDRYFNRIDVNVFTQLKIISIVECIESNASIKFLRTKINYPNPIIRDRIYEALKKTNYKASILERPFFTAQIDEKAALMVWILATQVDIANTPHNDDLIEALKVENNNLIFQLLNLLSLLSGDQSFDSISRMYRNGSAEISDFLAEILNITLADNFKTKLLPIFENNVVEERLRKLQVSYPQQKLSAEERAIDIINKDYSQISSYLKAISLRYLMNFEGAKQSNIFTICANSNSIIIKETSLYGLKLLAPQVFSELKSVAVNQQNDSEVKIYQNIEKNFNGSNLLINKIKELQKVDLFAKIPPDALIPVVISQKIIEMVSNETVIMKPYCKYVAPFVLVKSGEIEIVKIDRSTHLILENNYWYLKPDSSENNILYAINAISNSEVILLDSYLMYNLLIEKNIIIDEPVIV